MSVSPISRIFPYTMLCSYWMPIHAHGAGWRRVRGGGEIGRPAGRVREGRRRPGGEGRSRPGGTGCGTGWRAGPGGVGRDWARPLHRAEARGGAGDRALLAG